MAINVSQILTPGTSPTGAVPLVFVPDAKKSVSEAQARQDFENATLVPRLIRVEGSGDKAGTILGQDPEAGKYVPRRSAARIFIAVDGPPTQASLEQRFDDLDKAVSSITADVTTVKGTVVAAAADLATVKGDVTTVKNDAAAAKVDVAAVKKDVTAVKSDLTGIKADVRTAKTDLTTIKADVKNLLKKP